MAWILLSCGGLNTGAGESIEILYSCSWNALSNDLVSGTFKFTLVVLVDKMQSISGVIFYYIFYVFLCIT